MIIKKLIYSLLFVVLFCTSNLLAYDDPFLLAIAEGNINSVKAFIAKGVDVNKQIKHWAPLHVAAYEGKSEIVKLLVEAGALVNLDIKNLGTPLNYCTVGLGNRCIGEKKKQYLSTMQYLIDSGADVNAMDSYGRVPLFSAITYPVFVYPSLGLPVDTDFAELLIEYGADTNFVTLKNSISIDEFNKFQRYLEEKYPKLLPADFQFKLLELESHVSDASSLFSINDRNQVVGAFTIDRQRFFFILTPDVGMEIIDLPSTAQPHKITKRAHIAGIYTPTIGIKRGFLCTPEKGFLDIGTLGGSNTIIRDMNESDQIVGQSETGNKSIIDGKSLEKHAFLWQRGVMKDLEVLKGDLGIPGDESIATSINNAGVIIGTSNSCVCDEGKLTRGRAQVVFRKLADDHWQTFNDDSDKYIEAYSVNNSNQILAVKEVEQNNNALIVVDLKAQKVTPVSRVAPIHGRGSKISRHDLVFAKSNSQDAVVCIPEVNPVGILYNAVKPKIGIFDPRWDSVVELIDINSSGWMIGTAKTVTGETHGIILQPLNSNAKK